ncbi:MAG: OmpA family protein [Candidatus Nanopelagicales bacterium]
MSKATAASIAGLAGVGILAGLLLNAPSARTVEYPPGPTPTETATPAPSPTASQTPTPSPSPTPTPLPSPTATIVPEPAPGEATVTFGGSTVTFKTSQNAVTGSVEVSGGNLQLMVQPRSDAGAPVPLAPDGSMVVNPGGSVSTSGRGFLVGSPVNFYLISGGEAQFLGRLTVFSDGTFAGSVPVPADLAPGVYTLQISALAAESQFRADPVISVIQVSIRVEAKDQVNEAKIVRTIVYFDVLSAALSRDAKAELRRLASRLDKRSLRNRITIVGFVGPGGPSYNNKSLSQARARSVATYLRSLGVRGRYTVEGAGLSPRQGPSARRANVIVQPGR